MNTLARLLQTSVHFTLIFLSGIVLFSDGALSEYLKVECDVLFTIPTYVRGTIEERRTEAEKQSDSILKVLSVGNLALVPGSPPSFQSYWVEVDWDAHVGSVFRTDNYQNPFETYTVTSSKDWPFIVLEQGKVLTAGQSPAEQEVPIRFYIRRSSGWFMRQVGLLKDKPSIDVVEVGVCGGQPRF